jgi:7,8-dihydropterin-6-yl-methyl-4-(beta-D-ribofuranosyl)aminobenzene 5'-phosphate synthase
MQYTNALSVQKQKKRDIMKKIVAVVVIVAVCAAALPILYYRTGKSESLPGSVPLESITITVLYDNNPYVSGLKTDWGFSCLIEGTEKTILFDTGRDGDILLENVDALGVNLEEVDIVVISHLHGDHTGGLLHHVLKRNSDVTVYMPGKCSTTIKGLAEEKGTIIVEEEDPVHICDHVYTTGVLTGVIGEQSLIIETEKGLIVITGCAHPGVVHIVETAKEQKKEDILFVMGGFHLVERHSGYIESIVSQLKELGVVYAGPCHCSGDVTRTVFEEEFREYYVEVGVGRVITCDDLGM